MKTIIFSGPTGSGIATKARLLQNEISRNSAEHYTVYAPNRTNYRNVIPRIKSGKIKTLLLDGASCATIVNFGRHLWLNKFNGVLVATTRDKDIHVDELVETHNVQIHYLHHKKD